MNAGVGMKHSEPVGEAAEANPVHRPVRVMQILSRLGAGGSPPHVLCLNGKMPLYGYEMLLVSGTCSRAKPRCAIPGIRARRSFVCRKCGAGSRSALTLSRFGAYGG